MNPQIPIELLIQQLQSIPGISVSIQCGTAGTASGCVADITFETWARQWLRTYKMGIVKDNSYRGTYEYPVENHLIPYFGDRLLTAIGPADVQEFFKRLTNRFSMETQKKVRNALRAVFDTAIENGYCATNPVTRSLRLVSNVKPIKKHTWLLEQYETVYQFALGHRFGLHILTLMETAISRSELLGLTWDNLDIPRCAISIENGLVMQKSTKTNKCELIHDGVKNEYRCREIPISKMLCGLLQLQRRSVLISGSEERSRYIFCAPKGGPFNPDNWYKRVLKGFMEDLHEAHPEVRMLTTHELRHTRATLLKDEGRNLFSIARLLGHCDLNMLAKRYAHDNLEVLRESLGL